MTGLIKRLASQNYLLFMNNSIKTLTILPYCLWYSSISYPIISINEKTKLESGRKITFRLCLADLFEDKRCTESIFWIGLHSLSVKIYQSTTFYLEIWAAKLQDPTQRLLQSTISKHRKLNIVFGKCTYLYLTNGTTLWKWAVFGKHFVKYLKNWFILRIT